MRNPMHEDIECPQCHEGSLELRPRPENEYYDAWVCNTCGRTIDKKAVGRQIVKQGMAMRNRTRARAS
jgi:hypothetical protein